jgi:hypothetical protein
MGEEIMTKIYNTQQEVDADIIDSVLEYEGNIRFTFDNAIVEGDINARDIKALNITARDINAWNINARNITARDINAWNINARNITARNINAWDINAVNINFYAACIAYESITCESYKGRRENYIIKALDGDIVIKDKK